MEQTRKLVDCFAPEEEKVCTRVDVGHFMFSEGVVDITDPCYNKDVWCRINSVKILPGQYRCYVYMVDADEWGERVAAIGICKDGEDPSDEDFWIRGFIGVDAGLAGFFQNKADYSDEEWSQLCNEISDRDYVIRSDGFFSSSGFGDGSYDVLTCVNDDGQIYAIEIRFIT